MRVSPPSAYIEDTGTGKGRGVFAARSFLEGDVVEICPVVLFNTRLTPLPAHVRTLVFDWAVLGDIPETHALALGFGSMYNHDNPANLRYEADSERSLLRFIAVRTISPGDELTINYNARGGGAQWHDDNWFDRMKIRPIVDT